jgi:hypothetical protein
VINRSKEKKNRGLNLKKGVSDVSCQERKEERKIKKIKPALH